MPVYVVDGVEITVKREFCETGEGLLDNFIKVFIEELLGDENEHKDTEPE